MTEPQHVPLGDLVSVTRGTTYKSALLNQPGPVLLGLASIARNGGFRTDNLKTYGGECPEKLLVRPGDLFASLKDVTQSAQLLGSVARLPLNAPVGRLTQDTVRLDVVSDGVDPAYLYLSLLTPEYRQYCRGHATGTTNLGLPREDFLAYTVLLPPLSEQRRIAGVLGALDDLIDTNRRLAVDISLVQLARFKLTWGGATRSRLNEVATITMGQSPPGKSYNEDGDGTPFYQGTRDFGWRYPSRRVWTTQPTRLAHVRDVLVAVRAPVGELNLASETTALGRGVAGLRASGRQGTLFQALQADPRLWDIHQGTGTVFAAINKADMAALAVPWVDDGALEESLSEMDAAIANLEREVVDLTRARDELLPLLVSGRVRVEDVAVWPGAAVPIPGYGGD